MNEKDIVRKAFSKNSTSYITSTTHSKGTDLLLMKEWLRPESNMIALDIATGGGHVAKTLSPTVKHIFATDLTKEMLKNSAEHLKSYTNISYIVADAENLPFLDSTFDIITCRIAAHHFPNPNQFMQEVHRVLKPNGKFLFIDNIAPEEDSFDTFINNLEKTRDYSHVRSLKISEWKSILSANNMQIVKEKHRKKTLPFTEWVNRTLDTNEEKENVIQLLLQSSPDIQTYYEIETENGNIQSFVIDEWIVLCEKGKFNH